MNKYPPKELKRLYACVGNRNIFQRLEIEIDFHSKKVMCIHPGNTHIWIYFSEFSFKIRLYTFKQTFPWQFMCADYSFMKSDITRIGSHNFKESDSHQTGQTLYTETVRKGILWLPIWKYNNWKLKTNFRQT